MMNASCEAVYHLNIKTPRGLYYYEEGTLALAIPVPALNSMNPPS